jgi:hypothetical protein
MCFFRLRSAPAQSGEGRPKGKGGAGLRRTAAALVLIALAQGAPAQNTPEETGVEPGTTATTPLPNAPADNSSAARAPARRIDWAGLASLLGRTATDPDGTTLGPVANVLVDDRPGEPPWAVVDQPGFLDLGTRRMLVPVDRVAPPADPAARAVRTGIGG